MLKNIHTPIHHRFSRMVLILLLLSLIQPGSAYAERAARYYVTAIDGAQLYAEPKSDQGYSYNDLGDKQSKWLRIGLGSFVSKADQPAQTGSRKTSADWIHISVFLLEPMMDPMVDSLTAWVRRQDVVEESVLAKTRNSKLPSWNIGYYCQHTENDAAGEDVTELVFNKNGSVKILEEKVREGLSSAMGMLLGVESSSEPKRQETSGRYAVSGNLLILHHDKPQSSGAFTVYGYANGRIVPVRAVPGITTKTQLTVTQAAFGQMAKLTGKLSHCKAAPR